jgi:hypothetical protein
MTNYSRIREDFFRIPKPLIQDMLRTLSCTFKTPKDVINAIKHRLASISDIYELEGEEIGSDFILTQDETIITEILWLSGWRRSDGRMLCIMMTPTGKYIGHSWDHTGPVNIAILAKAVIPMFEKLEISYQHVRQAMRRRRGPMAFFSDSELLRNLILNFRDTDEEVLRTIHKQEISYLVQIPYANAFAACSYNKETKVFRVNTILSNWMASKHITSLQPQSVNG